MSRVLPIDLRHPDGRREPGRLAIEAGFTVDGPLVSCVMVSRGRRFPAEHAIRAFRRQTYRNRELVIVCAEPDPELPELLAGLGDPRIRFVAAAPAALGELRNIAAAHARGELLCHWDDDDLHGAERIAIQVATLAGGVQACFLDQLTLWWPAARRVARSGVRIWENSLLVWRRAQPIYPAGSNAEDTAVARMIIGRHPVALLRAPDAYVYVRHGGNFSTPAHFDALFEAGTPVDAEEAARWHRQEEVAAYAKALGGQ